MGCLARLLGDQERVASPVHDANVLEGFGEPWINRSGCVIQGLGRKSWYTQKAIKRKHLEVSNDKELYAPLKMKEQETDLWVEPQRLDYRTGQFGWDRDHPCRRATAGHQSSSTTGTGAVNTRLLSLTLWSPASASHRLDSSRRQKERKKGWWCGTRLSGSWGTEQGGKGWKDLQGQTEHIWFRGDQENDAR